MYREGAMTLTEREATRLIDDIERGAMTLFGLHATGDGPWPFDEDPNSFSKKIEEIADAR
jgi:hypothetical protein